MKIHILIYIILTVLLSSFASAVLNDAVAYYSFDNSTLFNTDNYDDISDSSFTLDNVGSMIYGSNGILNECIEGADTDNQYYTNLTFDADSHLGTDYTISVWTNKFSTHVAQIVGWDEQAGTGYQIIQLVNDYYRHKNGDKDTDTGNLLSNQWYHIVAIGYSNGTNRIYVNASLIATTTGGSNPDTKVPGFEIGDTSHAGLDQAMNGLIDELAIYNRSLSEAEITTLFNGGVGFNPYDVPPVITSSLDIIFTNSTDDATTTMGEGEDFNIFLNYTLSNGTILTDSTASCNVSVFDGLVELEGDFDNFTICDSGCNFSTRSKEFVLSSTNAVIDSLHFNGCHEQTASGNIEINISCSTGNEILTVLASEMPMCSSGTAFIRKTSAVCIGDSTINVSTDTAGNIPFSQRKRILNIAFDREYSEDINTATYNSSTTLWDLPHEHEFYSHGSQTINASCTEPTYPKNASETLTIVNAPPVIFIEQVNTSLGITTLSDGVTIEYADGIWNWFGAVIDDDLDTLNVTWYNSTGTNILSFQGSPSTTVLNTPDGFFNDFDGNTFSINISVNDTTGASTNASITFIVNDTIDPVCGFASEYTAIIGSTFNRTIICTDSNFYSLNITCTANNFSFYVDGLNTNSYPYNLSIPSVKADTCSYTYADGHTKNELTKYWDAITTESKIELLVSGDVIAQVYTDTAGGIVTYDILRDRIVYNFDMSSSITDTYKFYVNTSVNTNYLPSEQFKGWLVINNMYWLDFNSQQLDESTKVKVKKVTGGLYEITIKTKNKNIQFESIGELNIVSGSFKIQNTFNEYGFLNPTVCMLDETDGTLKAGLILIVLITMTLLAEFVYTMPVFGFLGGIGWLVYGLAFYPCTALLSGIFIAFGIFVLLHEMFFRN